MAKGTLTANRHSPSMTKATIATQIHQPFDVHGDLSPQVTFHLVITIDDSTDSVDLLFCQKIGLGIPVHIGLVQNPLRRGTTNAINVGKSYLNSLIFWQINACNPCQWLPSVIIPDVACGGDSHR